MIPIPKKFILIGIVLLVAIFGFGLFKTGSINFADANSFNKDTDTIKYQYTGEVPCNPETSSTFDISSYGISFSDEKVVNTAKSEFKFVVTNTAGSITTDGGACPSIRYDVKVYKDNSLIDTISGSPIQQVGTCHVWRREQIFSRAYDDEGNVYIPTGDEKTPIVYSYPWATLVESCPSGTYDARYPYSNGYKSITLPNGKTGINAVFGSDKGLWSSCRQKTPFAVHKYEIVGGVSQEIPQEETPTETEEVVEQPATEQTPTQQQTTSQPFNLVTFISNILKNILAWFIK